MHRLDLRTDSCQRGRIFNLYIRTVVIYCEVILIDCTYTYVIARVFFAFHCVSLTQFPHGAMFLGFCCI